MSAHAPSFIEVGPSYTPEELLPPQGSQLPGVSDVSPLYAFNQQLQAEEQLDGRLLANQHLTASDTWRTAATETGMPKYEIADYVEAARIPIGVGVLKAPRRWVGPSKAIKRLQSGADLIVRSDHEGEYDGPSDIFTSHTWNQAWIENDKSAIAKAVRRGANDSEVLDALVQAEFKSRFEGVTTRAQEYAKLNGLTDEQLMSGLQYSFWEKVPGINLMVVADDAVAGRYHIGAGMHNLGAPNAAGWIIDGDKITEVSDSEGHYLVPDKNLQEIVRVYEEIRHLDKFDPNNCPIVELQLDEERRLWFLQYLKGRTFEAPNIELYPDDYPESEGWVRAEAVRGWLGANVTLAMGNLYPTDYGHPAGIALPKIEEASSGQFTEAPLLETLVRRRVLSIDTHGARDLYKSIGEGHASRSHLFKSAGCLVFSHSDFCRVVSDELRHKANSVVVADRLMARVRIEAASDGTIGFARPSLDGDRVIIEHHS